VKLSAGAGTTTAEANGSATEKGEKKTSKKKDGGEG